MQNNTQGRVWLITVFLRFRAELALAAVAVGDRVMASARRPETLTELADQGKGRISTVALDVTDPASIDAAVRATLASYGRIDVLVNNACLPFLAFPVVVQRPRWQPAAVGGAIVSRLGRFV